MATVTETYILERNIGSISAALQTRVNAAVASGATVVQTISKKFDPQGVTVICLLSESHISIHTWPEEGKAAVDVYTCGDCNPKIGCDIIIQQLYAQNHTLSYIER
jgi:S-adenosylmethionine decarboxylase